ncbi:GNAT family N-acetyltransferase [Evansella halocellulosilytica]|uniref:GNAT family N-acetyltransferase n=1 Tax=Evansella halocellulosilytica TaxID=2011013 RepID=UPI000BB69F70|nr:GNAT family N-acetyltransferase [Evansella halocellulosilytica]
MDLQSSVVLLKRENRQIQKLAQAMSEAFYHEPNFRYIIHDDEKRLTNLQWFNMFTLRLGMKYGEVYSTDQATGGAVWIKPGNNIGFVGAIQEGLLMMPFKFGWQSFRRSMQLNQELEQIRKESFPSTHWYLTALAVHPSMQGKGIGGALIKPVLKMADKSKTSCYAETFKAVNISFYEKLGFQVWEEGQIHRNGPKFWVLVRKPL